MYRRFDLRSTLEIIRTDIDPDKVIMAFKDFSHHMQSKSASKFEANEQCMIVETFIPKFYDESSNEMNDVAIQCFVLIAAQITSTRALENLITNVFNNLVDPRGASSTHESKRDISVEILKKTLKIFLINKDFKLIIDNKLIVPLINVIAGNTLKDNAIGYILDALDQVVVCNGKSLDYSKLFPIMLPYLDRGIGGNKRRAVQCISHMTHYCADEQIDLLMDHILGGLEKSTSEEQIKIYVALIPLVANSIRARFTKYLQRTYTILKKRFDEFAEDEDEEGMKEGFLNAFNIIVLSVPNDLGDIIYELIALGTEYVANDPNVIVYSDDEEMDMDMEMDDMDEEEIIEDENDVSWKLRKLAGEMLQSIIAKRPDVLNNVIEKGLSVIVSRFIENVDIVLTIVIQLYRDILKTINDGNSADKTLVEKSYEKVFSNLKMILSSKKSGEKSKISALEIVKEMSRFNPTLFVNHIEDVKAMIVQLFNEHSSNVEIVFALCDTLRGIFKTANSDALDIVVSPILVERFNDRNFRIAMEVIKTESVLVENITNDDEGKALGINNVVNQLIAIVTCQDKDYDVKEQAVFAIGIIVKKTIGILADDEVRKIFDDLFNLYENTHLKSAALQVIHSIISKRLFEIVGKVDEILIKTVEQTKQATRQVKVAALMSAKSILDVYSDIKDVTIKTILPTIANYIFDNDSFIVDLSVNILTIFAKRQPIAKTMVSDSYRKLVEITKGNNARESFAPSFMAITTEISKTAKADAVRMIMAIENHLYSRANLYLTGAMYAATEPNVDEVFGLVKKNVSLYKTKVEPSAEYYKTIVHIYCLGHLALKKVDISKTVETLVEYFPIDNDSLRQAASFALGSIPGIITFLFEKLKTTRTFPVMNAMKEAVKYINESEAEGVINQLIAVEPNDKITMPLSESFGRLISYNPNVFVQKYYLPALQAEEGNAPLIGSIKACMTSCDPKLFIPLIPMIVKKLNVKIPAVKGAVFSIVSYLLMNAKKDIYSYIPQIVDHLIPQTVVDNTYVTVAKFCNITHVIDNGLDSRKAVYDCLGVLIDLYLNDLDYTRVVDTLIGAIQKDNDHDIRLLCFNLMTKMVTINGDPMIDHIEDYSLKLRDLIKTSLDDKNKDADTPKQIEICKAVCRFIAKVSTHPLAKVSNEFGKLASDIANSAKVGPIYKTMAPKNEGN